MKQVLTQYTQLIALAIMAIGIMGCSEQEAKAQPTADIEISIGTNPHWGSLMFDIQAITDSTVITNVTINRGNCKLPVGTAAEISRTVSLKFGETYTGFSNNCKVDNVKEIEVTSSVGTFVYSF